MARPLDDEQEPLLAPAEREAIDRGRWFAGLSAMLRHDVFRLGRVRRFAHGAQIVAQGEPATDWFACASGAMRARRTAPSGRQVTLAYVEPGIWVGEAEVLHRGAHTYDVHAHGATTVLAVPEPAFRTLLRENPTFGEALLTLQARRIRYLYWMMEDLGTLPLRARLAKQLLHLHRRFGPPAAPGASPGADGVPLGLSLVQDELAQLLGGSRQRINLELKWMEREGALRLGPRGILLRDRALLEQLAKATPTP